MNFLKIAPVILFFMSGATALVYEVLWSKYLALMLGSTTQAQTVVLAVYMGGLALGNRWFGAHAARRQRPLAWYGYLEAAIGLYAFIFYWLYQGADRVFVAVGSGWLDHGLALLALKGLLSVGLLLPPTILMGGTLPVLAAWLEARYPDAARWSARFYSLNSCGAVLGAGFAGFVLLDWVGMVASLQMTAFFNVLVGFMAIGLSKLEVGPATATPKTATTESAPATDGPSANPKVWTGYALAAFTGGVSLGLEGLASRTLSMVMGASVPAFSIMLMAFILGIGVGSAVIASPRIRRWPRERMTFILLLMAAGTLAGYVAAIGPGVDAYRWLMTGLARGDVGYEFQLLLHAAIALVVLGWPAALLGSVLPLWMREGGGAHGGLARHVGRLLTWNTVGAVLGVTLTSFVLMPTLGLRGALLFLAGLLAVVAGLVAWAHLSQGAVAASGVGLAAVLLVGAHGGDYWRSILSSGIFRARETQMSRHALQTRFEHVRLRFYEDAPDATVSVEQGDGVKSSAELGLRINGKPDASSQGDLSSQYLLAHLPLLARPASEDVFVLGLGSGITAGALLAHPVKNIVVAENCDPMLRAAAWFNPWNRGILTNRLARIVSEDARAVLRLSPQLYDVIISEPSNPWTAGIGNVFSREFFELAAQRLKPGGVMAQWFHLYEMNDGIVAMIIRTFGSVFPHMEIWDTCGGDIVMLGSRQPWASTPASYAQIFARPEVKADLVRIGLDTPEALWARQLASQRTAFAIAGDGPIQSDEFPVLERAAPRAFFIGAHSQWLFDFDERTWQWPLASAAKRQALAGLSTNALHRVFDEFKSVNSGLAQHLAQQMRGGSQITNLSHIIGKPGLPCIFTQTGPQPIPASGRAEEHRFWQAEAQAWQSPWPAAAEALDQALRDWQGKAEPPVDNEAFTRAIASAAKAALAHDDAPRAAQWLSAGLRADPASAPLLYLARILEREHPAKP